MYKCLKTLHWDCKLYLIACILLEGSKESQHYRAFTRREDDRISQVTDGNIKASFTRQEVNNFLRGCRLNRLEPYLLSTSYVVNSIEQYCHA